MSHYRINTEANMLTLGTQLARIVARTKEHSDGSAATSQPSTILFLEGPLGAGKTTLVRGFLHGLGYTAKVKSPTYTIVEPYEIAGKTIFHFDLYRLQSPKELEHIGIQEYFTPTSICLIEWPEKGIPLLPEADLACYIAFTETGREVRLQGLSSRGQAIVRQFNP
jgi:tRNA threonylcarbamoyladenosine biosynthesis protein TsaE